MSAESLAKLRSIWEKLHFSTIKTTVAREPEDIQSITMQLVDGEHPNGTPRFSNTDTSEPYRNLKRLSDIPEEERYRARVAWRHYYGFTTDNIYFGKDDYRELDLDIDLTLYFGKWGNHLLGNFYRPDDGSIICGEVIDTPRGKRYRNWFVCDDAFKLLVDSIVNGIDLSEAELGRRLLTDGYPDKYWALARLFLFDNVQAFVEQLKVYEFFQSNPFRGSELLPESFRHPGAGMTYGSHGFSCSDTGMYLPKSSVAHYLHLLSVQFEPNWWKEFLRLTEEQGVEHSHPSMGDVCNACLPEMYNSGFTMDYEYGYHDSDFPYSEASKRRKKFLDRQ